MKRPKNSPGFGKYAYKKRVWIYNNVVDKEFLVYFRFKEWGYCFGFTSKHIFKYKIKLNSVKIIHNVSNKYQL